MDELSKIWTPKKKDQSAETHTPSEIGKFLPYPSEKTLRSKDADAHNVQTTHQKGALNGIVHMYPSVWTLNIHEYKIDHAQFPITLRGLIF
jgi:hypothetical protein